MSDFVNWVLGNGLAKLNEDGTVSWRKGHKCDHKEKIDGGRDGRKDLSGDYKGHSAENGTVWPWKVLPKGKQKS